MKTLSEHFAEMLYGIKISDNDRFNAYRKLSELNRRENNLMIGGEIVSDDDLIKCTDEIRQFTFSDKTFNGCVRKIIRNNNKMEYYLINFYSSGTECVAIQIDFNKKKAHLVEIIKQTGCLMQYEKKNQFQNMPKDMGELLMEIVIKICIKLNVNELTLTDNSYITCKTNPNKRINLVYSKMILDGITWYSKFGFEPKEDVDKLIYIQNHEKYNKILTKDVKSKYFIKKIQDEYIVNKILKKYEEMKEDRLFIFMSWISENYCEIYSDIYENIYEKAGYKKYSTLDLILKLNTDLSEFVNLVKKGKL
jgi:hypothetical protein